MTRGRLWIGVLGVLLAGIVALNVYTLSLAAKVGPIDQNIQALESENSLLRSRDAQRSGSARVRHDAGALGMEMAAVDEVATIEPARGDVAAAAQRLAAAGTGY
jgi:Tfp pilus assembly protein PilN